MKQGVNGGINEPGNFPMLHLCHELQKPAHDVSKNLSRTSVVIAQLDSYSNGVIAPDYLLAEI